MIVLTAEKIRDFMGCRYLYKAKHLDKIPQKYSLPERDTLPSQLEDAIIKTIKYFYFEQMNGNILPYKELQKKFEKIWLKEKTVKDIINDSTTPKKNIHHFTTEGLKVIHNFYLENYKNPGKVLFLSEHYNIKINDEITINGMIDLVVQKNNNIIIPIYSGKGKIYFAEGSEGYYKMLLDTIAFREKSGLIETNNTIILFKGGDIKREDLVIDKLKIRQVKEVMEEINECKRFLPNHDYYWCKNCSMSKYCSTW